MENNEIMKRLMEDDNHAKSQESSTPTKEIKKESETSLSKIRVVTAKYKVLTVLFLIFICILGIYTLPDLRTKYDNTIKTYEAQSAKLNEVHAKIIEAGKDVDLLTGIVYNEQNLARCLNNEDSQICSSLPKGWKTWTWEDSQYDFTIPLSYLQLHSLYNEKLSVDEKKVLKNLNKYLIKENIEWTWKNEVWKILKISIWDPEVIGYWTKETPTWNPDDPVKKEDIPNFFVVPVDVEIEFKEIDDLIWFLYNVEKKLIEDHKDSEWKIVKDSENRILYKIQTVSYDIIANDEPQVTDISMLAYYYDDERFEDIDEYKYYFEKKDTTSSDSTDKDSKKNNKSTNKSSFLDNIFK